MPTPQPPLPTAQQYAPLSGNGLPQGIIPVGGPIAAKDLAGGNYLKGEDLPVDAQTVAFKIIQFVKDPRGRSPLVALIPEMYGKKLVGLNVTNIRLLMNMGYVDLQTLVGKTIHCNLGYQPNPSRGGAPTRAFFVSRVE